jgi:hypothetical protein
MYNFGTNFLLCDHFFKNKIKIKIKNFKTIISYAVLFYLVFFLKKKNYLFLHNNDQFFFLNDHFHKEKYL